MKDHPISSAALRDRWPAFAEAVFERLVVGAREYGDRSFDRTPVELLREIQEELRDVTGWSFIEHERIERLIRELEKLKVPA